MTADRTATRVPARLPVQGGQPVDLLQVTQDAVVRLTTVAAELDERLEAVEELAGIGSWWWDLDDPQVRWSPTVYRILGSRRSPCRAPGTGS